MKKLPLLASIVGILSCVGGGFAQKSKNNSLAHELTKPSEGFGGLTITMTNSLAPHGPKLKFQVCAANATKKDELCFGADTAIIFRDTAHFVLKKDKLRELLKETDNNEVTIKFNDSDSDLWTYGRCKEHPKTKLKVNTEVSQYLTIEVTEVNAASYSCTIN